MVSIKPQRLYASYDELKSAYKLLNHYLLTIQEVEKSLAYMEGIDDILTLFHKLEEKLNRNIEQCYKMCQSIDIICGLYSDCESRVCDIAEGTVKRYLQPKAVFVNLSESKDLIKEFSIV